MEKKYLAPATEVLDILTEDMIAFSGMIGETGDDGIGYGGVDVDGGLTPFSVGNDDITDFTE